MQEKLAFFLRKTERGAFSTLKKCMKEKEYKKTGSGSKIYK